MRWIVRFETPSADYQVIRRRKERNWRSEGGDFIVGKQKL